MTALEQEIESLRRRIKERRGKTGVNAMRGRLMVLVHQLMQEGRERG